MNNTLIILITIWILSFLGSMFSDIDSKKFKWFSFIWIIINILLFFYIIKNKIYI